MEGPIEVYDGEWAASLVRHALDRPAQECALAGKADLFSCLTPRLPATEESTIPYEEMARWSHRPVTSLRYELARLRTRYRAILREEVRVTVREASEVDEELRYLCRALATTRPLTPTHALAKKYGRTPQRPWRLGNRRSLMIKARALTYTATIGFNVLKKLGE
jgi:hypothetical protein